MANKKIQLKSTSNGDVLLPRTSTDQVDGLQSELNNIAAIAEGKCNTYVVSYQKAAPTTDAEAQAMINGTTGEHFLSLQAFENYIENDDLLNPLLNSQEQTISVGAMYLIDNDNVVYNEGAYNRGVGDIILIIETDVPDRWLDTADGAQILETSKVDLTTYYTKTETNNLLANKQNSLSASQLNATNSGITSGKVSTYDGYATTKQDTLSSGTNIKTINGTSLLGSGDLVVGGEISYEEVVVFEGLCFTAQAPNSTVELTVVGSPSIANTAYSFDGSTWTTFTPSTTSGTNTITLANIGDFVYFRNDITGNLDNSNYMRFVMSGLISASGNCNSMYAKTGYENLTTLAYSYCYKSMFSGCTSLTTAPQLPATTLAEYCYRQMFYGCTSLTTVPSLPATTLAGYCYEGMFSGCTSLTTAPSLPATSLVAYCYHGMFHSCTQLTSAPQLPATTLSYYCYYNMFYGCTSLTTAPQLPATTLAEYCYRQMFYGCTSLTTAPSLPATTLAGYCYYNMFYGCTSLTTAPSLPATTLAGCCYYQMFNGCTSLTTAPSLPATSLVAYCYKSMFSGCTSLTTAPQLPATTLANNCYYNMFSDCTSLYVSDTSTSSATHAWRMPTSGTFTNTYSQGGMFGNCLGTRSSDDMPGASGSSYTYYTQNEPI